ncbi:MAG: copper amine oxidase family protein [Bacilli bacterium]|nr:copper amine oxidase family protein [Bacilli bacterium]
MKKLSAVVAGIVLSVSLSAGTVFAADLKLEVDGKPAEFQFGTPFIQDGRSLMPLRDLLVALGVPNDDEHIIWNQDEKSVLIEQGNIEVKLAVGDKTIYKNGKMFKDLEVPAQQVKAQNDRIFLPARAVAEALENDVSFNAGTNSVIINQRKTISIDSTDGITYTLPDITPAAGQIYGLIDNWDKESHTFTIKAADGTSTDIKLLDNTLVKAASGSHPASDYYDMLTNCAAALITLGDDGTPNNVVQYDVSFNATYQTAKDEFHLDFQFENAKEGSFSLSNPSFEGLKSIQDLKDGDQIQITGQGYGKSNNPLNGYVVRITLLS